jgi:hypothetical protein
MFQGDMIPCAKEDMPVTFSNSLSVMIPINTTCCCCCSHFCLPASSLTILTHPFHCVAMVISSACAIDVPSRGHNGTIRLVHHDIHPLGQSSQVATQMKEEANVFLQQKACCSRFAQTPPPRHPQSPRWPSTMWSARPSYGKLPAHHWTTTIDTFGGAAQTRLWVLRHRNQGE